MSDTRDENLTAPINLARDYYRDGWNGEGATKGSALQVFRCGHIIQTSVTDIAEGRRIRARAKRRDCINCQHAAMLVSQAATAQKWLDEVEIVIARGSDELLHLVPFDTPESRLTWDVAMCGDVVPDPLIQVKLGHCPIRLSQFCHDCLIEMGAAVKR